MNRYGKKKRFIKKPRNDSEGDELRELEREKERQTISTCGRCKLNMGWDRGVAWIWRGEGYGSDPRLYCIGCTWAFVGKSGLDYEVCATSLSPSGAPDPYFGG
jgi:hypothetical protein